MIELGQTPVYQAKFSKFMIYHYIMGLDISMHNALRMAVIQSLQLKIIGWNKGRQPQDQRNIDALTSYYKFMGVENSKGRICLEKKI